MPGFQLPEKAADGVFFFGGGKGVGGGPRQQKMKY